MAVTRIVTRTPTILVTIGTLEIFDIKKRRQLREWHLRGFKNEWTPTIPVTAHIFESLGLAVKGPYHGVGVWGGGGALLTRDTIPYRV